MEHVYYHKEKRLLVVTDTSGRVVAGFSGDIAERKYNAFSTAPMPYKPLSRFDLQNEIELCRSVLLNNNNLPPDLRADYQKRYRKATRQLELLTNDQLQK